MTEALFGQLYLVSAVALLIANIGRSRHQGGADAEMPDVLEEIGALADTRRGIRRTDPLLTLTPRPSVRPAARPRPGYARRSRRSTPAVKRQGPGWVSSNGWRTSTACSSG